jgi:hypothetical protein
MAVPVYKHIQTLLCTDVTQFNLLLLADMHYRCMNEMLINGRQQQHDLQQQVSRAQQATTNSLSPSTFDIAHLLLPSTAPNHLAALLLQPSPAKPDTGSPKPAMPVQSAATDMTRAHDEQEDKAEPIDMTLHKITAGQRRQRSVSTNSGGTTARRSTTTQASVFQVGQ